MKESTTRNNVKSILIGIIIIIINKIKTKKVCVKLCLHH